MDTIVYSVNSNKMKTVSVVSTQLQLINVLEFLNSHDSLDGENVLIITTSIQRERQIYILLESLIKYVSFKKVIKIRINNNNRLYSYLTSICAFFRLSVIPLYNPIDYCIIGNYHNEYHRYIAFRLRKRLYNKSSIVVVDDGLATITCFSDRKKEICTGRPFTFGNRIIMLYFSILGRKLIPEQVVFYSFLDDLDNDIDKCEKNTFCFLKKHLEVFKIPEIFKTTHVIFLGTPLCQRGSLSKENYNYYLKKIIEKIGDSSFIYYGHPEEKDISWLSDEIKRQCIFIPNLFPVEYLAGVLDSSYEVYSFFSTSLVLLHKIAPSAKIISISLLHDTSFRNMSREALIEVYDYIEQNGVYVENW